MDAIGTKLWGMCAIVLGVSSYALGQEADGTNLSISGVSGLCTPGVFESATETVTETVESGNWHNNHHYDNHRYNHNDCDCPRDRKFVNRPKSSRDGT